jgi:hypothetical protein
MTTTAPAPAATATSDSRPLSMGVLVAKAAAVLWDAERWGLPGPRNVTVYDHYSGPELSYQFADDKPSFAAIAQWADAFGGTVASKTIRHGGSPARLCRVKFDYHGVPAVAYAIVTAAPATT